MRLTIVDRTTFTVREVVDNPLATSDVMDWLAGSYSGSHFVWFITAGEMPHHAQFNRHGQILSRTGRPILGFTCVHGPECWHDACLPNFQSE